MNFDGQNRQSRRPRRFADVPRARQRVVVGWGLPHQEAGPKESGGASPTLHITEPARQNSLGCAVHTETESDDRRNGVHSTPYTFVFAP